MNIRRHSITVFLLILAALVSAAVRAATFTSSLPLEPERLSLPFGNTVTVTLPEGFLDLPELPDNEYYADVSYEYRWSVPGGPSGDGRTARIYSSFSGGAGVIDTPGYYSVAFTGKATYTVRWTENGVEHSDGPHEVSLTASPGGRLELPFRLTAVSSVSCETVTSTTDTPGDAETLVVPVGHNNGSVRVKAQNSPPGDWPPEMPKIDGDVDSSDGDSAVVDTTVPGVKTVRVTCGRSVSIIIVVTSVSELAAAVSDDEAGLDTYWNQENGYGYPVGRIPSEQMVTLENKQYLFLDCQAG